MDLITPQLELTINENVNSPNNYVLNSTALFEQANVEVNGYEPIPDHLDENGILQIGLLILENENIPANNGSVVIKHEVPLGPLNFGTEDFEIEVNLLNQQDQRKGRGKTRKSSAVGIKKPMKN